MHYYLFVILVVSALHKLAPNLVPRLALVVVGVPLVDGTVEGWLESKGTGKDGGDINGVSLEKSGKLG